MSLRQVPLFAEVADDDLAEIEAQTKLRRFRKRTIIIEAGDESATLYVLLSGRVKVYLEDGAGKELVLGELGSGDHFGELALLGDSPRTASVSAVTDCEVRMLAGSAFDRLLAERPALARHLIRHLARRVGDLIDKARDLGLRSTYERIAKVLEEVAIDADDTAPAAPWLTHQGIADRAGCSREMVSRIIADLRTGGYVEQRGKHFVLLRKLPPRW